MTQYPETSYQAFKPKYRQIKWSQNEANFNAWCEGQTGFPIIDAAIMELTQTGFMHNRMRMVVSQFLTKDLFIDWTWEKNSLESTLLTMMQHQIFMDGNGLLLQVRMQCRILECLIQ